jgi:hypothetical protein
MAQRYQLTARAAAEADPVFRGFWEQGAKDELPRAEAWLRETGPAIAARLTAHGAEGRTVSGPPPRD